MIRKWKLGQAGERGHSLVETALVLPLLMCLAFNAVNIGYYWYVVLTLAASPRHGAQYATQGGAAMSYASIPSTEAVSELVYANLQQNVRQGVSASVRVCSSSKGVDGSTRIALCDSYGPAQSFATPAADPEQPLFVLHRVDVAYQVQPVIPGTAFNMVVPSNLVFRRQVSMRSLY